MKLNKWVFFIALVIFIIVLACTFALSYYKSALLKNSVLALATRLDYQPASLIRIEQNKGSWPDSNYSLTRVVYHTSLSLDEFTKKIDALGYGITFKVDSSPDSNFLSILNNNAANVSDIVFLGDHYGLMPYKRGQKSRQEPALPLDMSPQVTQWVLKDDLNKKFKINYAQTNSIGDSWIWNNSVVEGNIVEIVLEI